MKRILALIIGIVLIIAGTGVMVQQGVTLMFDVGSAQSATADAVSAAVTVPTLLGAIGLLAGVVIVLAVALWRGQSGVRQEHHAGASSGHHQHI